MKKLLYILLAAGLLAASALTAATIPASAQGCSVRLPTGQIVVVNPCPTGGGTPTAPAPQPTPPPSGGSPSGGGGGTTPPARPAPQPRPPAAKPPAGGGRKPPAKRGPTKAAPKRGGKAQAAPKGKKALRAGRPASRAPRMRTRGGAPTPQNPGFFEGLPGPSTATGVPNFVIRKFRVPPFLLPIYQAAGVEYGVRWEILAAINEIETDYGRNLNVSSAGALGWMQFIPSSWRAYGVDANKDGVKDPYNPVDAIFAAGRYLKAAGYEQDVRRAIFAYNHADWYVDSVLLRARLIAGVPADLVGSLTGLTEGRPPIAARARYADDLQERELRRRVGAGENAANVVGSSEQRRGIEIFARKGAPVVAVNDGVVKQIGHNRRLGRFLVLQDVYGNRYTYGHLGELARFYPVPRGDVIAGLGGGRDAKALSANDPRPQRAASAGRQSGTDSAPGGGTGSVPGDAYLGADSGQSASVPVKERLFAHPRRPNSFAAGGDEQLLDAGAQAEGFTTRSYFARPIGLRAEDVRLRRLKPGARVIGGTILARIAKPTPRRASHLYFEIRPAGRGAPRIDPKPIIDGWYLLAQTKIYGPTGRNVLRGEGVSIGQILLLPKPLLERRVLSDARIEIYDCGRGDVRSGQISRNVLATLAYLAESGMRPSVSSLKCGHSFYTSSGSVSHHSSGNAVDIAAINGIPILGHQEPGGITEQAVRRLMALQGTLRADQIISLLDLGGPTLSMADHADHIHVGFRPLFGENRKLGQQALAVLGPGQWSDLLKRLAEIDNPVVATKPSRYSIPVKKKHRGSGAHRGE